MSPFYSDLLSKVDPQKFINTFGVDVSNAQVKIYFYKFNYILYNEMEKIRFLFQLFFYPSKKCEGWVDGEITISIAYKSSYYLFYQNMAERIFVVYSLL